MATQEPAIRPSLPLGPRDDGRALSAGGFRRAEFLGPWKYERVGRRSLVMSPGGEASDDCSEPPRDHLGAYFVVVDHLAGRVTFFATTPGGVRVRVPQRSQDDRSELLPGLVIPPGDVLPE